MHAGLSCTATVLALIHLALGCYWHHGFALAHACHSQPAALSGDDHGCAHHHGPHSAAIAEQASNQGLPCVAACHQHEMRCFDDRCQFLPATQFEFQPADDPHPGGLVWGHHKRPQPAGQTGVIGREAFWRAGIALPVRAHLLHCVLII